MHCIRTSGTHYITMMSWSRQLTLFVQPATGGSWEYSSGTLREVSGVSSKFRASDPLGSETSGTVVEGVGSNRDMSDEICGAITGMVGSNLGWGCCLSVGTVIMSSKLSPSKSALQEKMWTFNATKFQIAIM